MVVALTDRDGDTIEVAGNPLKFANERPPQHAYPHRLGADSAGILHELLGMPEDEIASLAKEGIIAVT